MLTVKPFSIFKLNHNTCILKIFPKVIFFKCKEKCIIFGRETLKWISFLKLNFQINFIPQVNCETHFLYLNLCIPTTYYLPTRTSVYLYKVLFRTRSFGKIFKVHEGTLVGIETCSTIFTLYVGKTLQPFLILYLGYLNVLMRQ